MCRINLLSAPADWLTCWSLNTFQWARALCVQQEPFAALCINQVLCVPPCMYVCTHACRACVLALCQPVRTQHACSAYVPLPTPVCHTLCSRMSSCLCPCALPTHAQASTRGLATGGLDALGCTSDLRCLTRTLVSRLMLCAWRRHRAVASSHESGQKHRSRRIATLGRAQSP
jgi:hypothetical protein